MNKKSTPKGSGIVKVKPRKAAKLLNQPMTDKQYNYVKAQALKADQRKAKVKRVVATAKPKKKG
jgi:hypothetical protein